MLYLSGVVRPDMPAMLTPRMGQLPPDGQPWAADNARFGGSYAYTDAKYLAWLERMAPYRDRCLFATAPDVVGDARATLALSEPMFPRIRALGYPVALVAQDGLEYETVPWDSFDALFVGGSTEWKLWRSEVLIRHAKERGKWVHMGRVNSQRRLELAASFGCDSADGTVLKHDPGRGIRKWVAHVRSNPSLWRESNIRHSDFDHSAGCQYCGAGPDE